ncbi:MAG: 50S ribosomal protein L29 [Pseudomonadota bacterium]
MKASELREQSTEALRALLLERRRDQFRQRTQKATGQLEASHVIRTTRRDIARIKTVLRQRKQG